MSRSGRPKVPIQWFPVPAGTEPTANCVDSVAGVAAGAHAEPGEPAGRGHPHGRDVVDRRACGPAPEDLLDLTDRGVGTFDHAPNAAVSLVGDPAGQAALGRPTQHVVAEADALDAATDGRLEPHEAVGRAVRHLGGPGAAPI